MSRILFIGNSYPLFTYNSEMNLRIAEELKKAECDLYLLSRSWCTVREDNFYGNVDILSDSHPFKKRFFVDPVQLRASGIELMGAMTGLCIKILEQEKIDTIVFADDPSYLPVVETARNRFAVHCYLFLFQDEHILYRLFDNYLYPIFQEGLHIFEKVFTYSAYRKVLTECFSVEESRIIPSCPLVIPDNPCPKNSSDTLYVFVEPYSTRYAKHIYSLVKKNLL